ncbi:hypothetical protein GW17_00038421 [Ensete ventricosum]|nr:hypothetical protein GW17_00038421 [Ensete ventricosum]
MLDRYVPGSTGPYRLEKKKQGEEEKKGRKKYLAPSSPTGRPRAVVTLARFLLAQLRRRTSTEIISVHRYGLLILGVASVHPSISLVYLGTYRTEQGSVCCSDLAAQSSCCLAVSYARSVSLAGDKFRSFRSSLRWMCVDQPDISHAMVSWSLFLLGVLVSIASHFILSYASTYRAYDVVI